MKTKALTKPLSAVFNKRTGMFLFFVFIAFIVWFITRMSGEYRAPLSLHVCIYSSANQHMPYLCSEELLPIVARTSGFHIVRQRLSKPPVVYVDVRGQQVRKANARSYMLTASLQSEITQLMSDDMQIEFYGTDTLFFSADNVTQFPTIPTHNNPETIYN